MTILQEDQKPYSFKTISILLLMVTLLSITITWSTHSCFGHDADSSLLAIMSIQEVTPYYWGQNRFGNLLPFLASWIDDININFKFQVFLRAFTASTIPLVVFILMDVKKQILLKYLLSISLFFFVFEDYLIMTLWTYGHPYGTASAILLLSLLLDKQNNYSLNYKSIILTSLIFLLLFLMFFVNLSFIVLIAPIFFGFLLISFNRQKLIFLLMLIFAWLAAKYHTSFYGSEGYSQLNLTDFLENLYQTFFISNPISLHSNTSYMLLLILFISFLLSLIYLQTKDKPMSSGIVNPYVLKSIIILSSIVVYIFVVANIKWIEMNIYAGRYFIISFAFLLSLIAITFIDLGIKILNKNIIKMFVIILFIGSLYKALYPIDFSCKFSDDTRKEQVETITNMAIKHDVSIIVGDYWITWPSVYDVIHSKQISQMSNSKQVYGFTFRGWAVRSQIKDFIENRENIQLLCIDMDINQCFKETKNYFMGNWPGHSYLLDSNKLSDGREIIVLGFSNTKTKAMELDLKPMNKTLNNPKVNYKIIEPYNHETNTLKLKVTNTGNEKWLAGFNGKYGLALSYKLENKSIGIKTAYNNRFHLPYNIEAGESFEITIPIENLDTGENIITFSMVQELVAWFHDKGNKTLSIKIKKGEI